MTTRPQNLDSIEKGTGITWDEWLDWLNSQGAKDLSHTEIAKLVNQKLKDKIESAGWWSQGITVAYEQRIGRRQAGQRNDGSFELSVSKIRDASREEAFRQYTKELNNVTKFNSCVGANKRTSETPVRSYWRCDLEDGSKVTWAVEKKEPQKSLLVITHTGLTSSDVASEWKGFWKEYIDKLD
jgi:hypothetical protein